MAYYFRLPIITDLTVQQQAVLTEPGPIAVAGGPGTGKSVVTLWRHIQNHDMERRRSLLLTYTKSLEYYLSSAAKNENEKASTHTNRTYWWTTHLATNDYDEIIIDEAQDVEEQRYNIINALSDMVSFSADDNQMLYPNRGTNKARLCEILNITSDKLFELQDNFRNTFEIVQFVRSLFPNRLITPGDEHGPKPSLILSNNDIDTQIQIVCEIIREFQSMTHNIAVLLPLIDMPNAHQSVIFWYNQLKDKFESDGIKISKFTNMDDEIGLIENVHVTTYKSSKGLEFDTVIVPNFHKFRDNINNLYVVTENDYYVVLTRSKRNLFLIDGSGHSNNSCDLNFMQLAIQRNIVEINDTYTNQVLNQQQIFHNEDVLPF
jgi:superfamily I DNA/RNA helicase